MKNARRIVAECMGAAREEIVFTAGATAGLNLLAAALGEVLRPGRFRPAVRGGASQQFDSLADCGAAPRI